jgi:hypothetical protein
MLNNSQDNYLVLHKDDWAECLYQSLFYLRQSWARGWIGLPDVVKSCAAFLSLQAPALSLQAGPMLSAALGVAGASERQFAAPSSPLEPHYHSRLHTADVLTAMALQLDIEVKLGASPDSDWMCAALLAAMGHDFMHPGGVNNEVSQMEKQTCELLRPIMEESKVASVWIERVETAILRSDFSLAAQNHEEVKGYEFAWNQKWLNVLLNEADILPSSHSSFGQDLSQALSQEWKAASFAPHETVATPEGRQAFLRSVKFSSRSSRLLISSALNN